MLENKWDRSGVWQLIESATKNEVSYLYMGTNCPVFARKPAEDLYAFEPCIIGKDDLDQFVQENVPPSHREILEAHGYTRLVFPMNHKTRCRLDLAKTADGLFMLAHIVTATPPEPESIRIGRSFGDFASKDGGLYIVSSRPRSGKSTVLASLVAEIASTRGKHIMWVSRASEYVFRQQPALITQIEVDLRQPLASNIDVLSTLSPDVIAVDMPLDERFLDRILFAAENGSQVFLSVQSSSSVNSLYSLLSTVSAEVQKEFRYRMAQVFERAAYVELVKANGEVFPAVEVLTCTEPVKNLLREGKYLQIADLIPTGAKYGMQTLEKSKSDIMGK